MTPRVAVVEFAGRGGMVHYAFQLCRALAGAGAEVTLYTDRSYELEALDHPFEVVRLLRLWDPKPAGEHGGRLRHRLRRLGRGLRYYREWWRLARRLRRDRPDLVQLGDVRFPGDLLCLWLLRAWGLRLVDVCHNIEPFRQAGRSGGGFRASGWLRRVYRSIYRCFERVFVHYPKNRHRFLSIYGGPPSRVVAIPHGNEALFDELRAPGDGAAALRRELGLEREARVVLLFGSLSRYKGADLLVSAFAEVHRAVPEARLVIAGFPLPDFDLAGLKSRIAGLGLTEAVRLVPRYVASSEVAAWMELATVAALPYREISQSGALLVAQTFGVPVVATRVGAMAEAAVDGESALLVPPDDVAELGRALARVLTDEALRRRLAAGARRQAFEVAGWEAIAARMYREYLDLVGLAGAEPELRRARLERP